MIVTILRAVIDPTFATRSRIRRHMQVMTQLRSLVIRRDAPSVPCLNPGHLAPVAQETEA